MGYRSMSLRIRRSAPIPALALLALGTLLGSTACSSTTSASTRATAASESMQAFNASMIETRDGISATIESLNALMTASGNAVKPAFAAFKEDLADLHGRAEAVRAEAAAMKERGDEYFQGWEAGSSSISPERHDQLATAYSTIKQAMTRARAEFEPFLASLDDVESYLSLDLTKDGLEGAEPLADAATDKGAQVKAQLDAVLQQVNAVRGMISPGMER